jgi:hypothetical protein
MGTRETPEPVLEYGNVRLRAYFRGDESKYWAFSEPGLGRQRAMRSGLGRPTVTFIACETTPVRVRERRTGGEINYNRVQYNSVVRGRTAKPTNMEVPPRLNAAKVDEGEEHHRSEPGKYTQHPVLRTRKALEENESRLYAQERVRER